MTCINPQHLQNIEKDLRQRGFSFGSIAEYKRSTADRLAYFDGFLNNRSESEFLNNRIEKYLLKNQQENLQKWADKKLTTGINTDSTKTLIEKIHSLKEVLDPKSNKDREILNGLVKQKLGFTVTDEYAKLIYDTYNTYQNRLEAFQKNHPEYNNLSGIEANKLLLKQIEDGKGDLYDLGLSLIELKSAYEEARLGAEHTELLSKKTTVAGKKFEEFKEGLVKYAGVLKSFKATLDVSAPRQLMAGAVTSKEFFNIAKENYKKSLGVWWDVTTANLSVEDAKNLVDMLILTRPNALNGVYRKIGLDVGLKEEAFPETWIGKKAEKFTPLPASEIAYSYALQLTRADWADIKIKDYGNDIGAMKKDGLGDYINQISGRGKVHFKWNGDTQSLINVLFFAPRFLAAKIRTITDLQYVVSGKTEVEKMRAKTALNNALFLMLAPMLLKAISRALDKDDPHGEDALERFLSAFDPRSSEFGKFRIGDTRIDASFGMASLYTTLARGISLHSVTSAGVTKDTTWGDVLSSFFEGKLSPTARVLADAQSAAWGSGKGFGGQKITFAGELSNAFVPISAESAYDVWKAAQREGMGSATAGAAALGLVLDVFGVNASTYEPSERDLGKSKELLKAESKLAWNIDRRSSNIKPEKTSSIMTKLSGTKQERAIADFSKMYNDKATALVKSAKYQSMSDEQKNKALKDVRADVNKAIKKKYGLK